MLYGKKDVLSSQWSDGDCSGKIMMLLWSNSISRTVFKIPGTLKYVEYSVDLDRKVSNFKQDIKM